MLYATPRALPPHLEELRDISKAMQASHALVVGSALRDADNGIPVTSYSLFVMPIRGKQAPDDMIATFIKEAGPGTRVMRTPDTTRSEIRHANGMIVNLNFCYREWMLRADSMAQRVPNGLSSIATDLFAPSLGSEVYVAQLYHIDRDERTITQKVPSYDPLHVVARSVQTRYPTYPILSDLNGAVIQSALKAAAHAALPA